MNKVKMIMCDIDGTLITDTKQMTDYTRHTLSKLKSHNIKFSICTGRSLEAITRLIKQWKIEDYCDILIGMNGNHIIDLTKQQEYTIKTLNYTILTDILNKFKHFNISIGASTQNIYHSTLDNDENKRLVAQNQFNYTHNDFEVFKTHPIFKVCLLGKKEELDQVEQFAKENSDSRYDLVRSTSWCLEAIPCHTSKATGIAHIANCYNINLDNIAAFGDEMNDLEMFKACGVSVLMKNGNPKLTQYTHYQTQYTNNEDGVAHFIEEHFL